ncbi:MAG: DUF512 domain-containing protein [Defluviitaleaceae bacterium]|nr:DUF512 domain-containing protein [Defluviitaleaceae bacterium]
MAFQNRKHRITAVTPDSIADQLEIAAGDFLMEIDGTHVDDVFDYRMAIASEELTLLIEKADGELWELEIEKDEDEDLGLEFESALMDDVRICRNRCIFCFVDQQPPGLRDSLYIKDDDVRLSFLHGNYVTLTNIDEAEVARIARYHLSPLRISVHTTDADLRCQMTGNPHAGKLFSALEAFNAAGIQMHFQAVICKSYNDGAQLDKTISGLLQYRPGAQSLAIVPAGTTRHRDDLAALAPLTPGDALRVIRQVEAWQVKCLAQIGTRFVYAADEWYVLAELPAPDAAANEDFPQLENGVGLCALFAEEFADGLCTASPSHATDQSRTSQLPNTTNQPRSLPPPTVRVGIITGIAAADCMRGLAARFMEHHPHSPCEITIYPIRNDFFGDSVTVSGLLTGQDVINQLAPIWNQLNPPQAIFLPANAFRADTEDMLDGLTRTDVEAALGIPVYIGSADGAIFANQLLLAQ